MLPQGLRYSMGFKPTLVSLGASDVLLNLQARTYPDLLKSPHDEELMEHYCQSSLVYINVRPCFGSPCHQVIEMACQSTGAWNRKVYRRMSFALLVRLHNARPAPVVVGLVHRLPP